jgi:hypothetical protein
MVVSIQRKLDQRSTMEQERLFFSQSLAHLSACSGSQEQPQDWMITEYEVDFMEEIGSGGLCVASPLHRVLRDSLLS